MPDGDASIEASHLGGQPPPSSINTEYIRAPTAPCNTSPLQPYTLTLPNLIIHRLFQRFATTMQSNQASRSASASTVPDASRSPSVELLFPDGATNKCIFKHCHVSTSASTHMASLFYMRSHMRTMAENSSTGSHPGSKSPVPHPEANPFYLMEEYCGVSLGRDVERMLAVHAEDVCKHQSYVY